MFRQLSLKAKLVLSFMSFALFLVAGGLFVFYEVETIEETVHHLTEVNLASTNVISDLIAHQKDATIAVLNVTGTNTDEKQYQAAFDGIEHSIKEFETDLKAYEAIPFVEGEEAVYKVLTDAWVPYREMARKLISLSKPGQTADHALRDQLSESEFSVARARVRQAMSNLVKFQDTEAHEWSNRAVAESNRMQRLIMISIALAVAAALAMGFFLSTSIAKSLQKISHSLTSSAHSAGLASRHLSSTSSQLSTASTEAAASLEETVASIEELSAMVATNAESARQAGSLSAESTRSAELGEQEIQRLITAMAEMSAGSRKIEEIMAVIDDLAFQTNLLALNAAVEAARAGEQGRGFAVVAEAVRALAQRSADSAKSISEIIRENAHRAEQGSQIADRSGRVLKEIVEAAKKVETLNTEIAAGSQEQSKGISQISQAMSQLDQTTQSNAAAAEEISASSEELSSRAVELHRSIEELGRLVDGGSFAGGAFDATGAADETHSARRADRQAAAFKRAA